MRHHLPTAAMLIAGALTLTACSGDLDLEGAIDASPAASTTSSSSEPSDLGGKVIEGDFDSSNFDRYDLDNLYWPATVLGYVFSDTPQSDSEQWIFDTYPELWAQGVRALAVKDMQSIPGEDAVPGVLVQYVAGERYEGNEAYPLGFRGARLDDPLAYPSDAVDDSVALLAGEPTKQLAKGGYSISILENYDNDLAAGRISDDADTVIAINEAGIQKETVVVTRFADKESAWAWLQSNGVTIGEGGNARRLHPGEVSMISAITWDFKDKSLGTGVTGAEVFDPSTGTWVRAVEYE